MKKNRLVKYLKTEIFQFQSMEHRSNANPVRQIQTKIFIAFSIGRATGSINQKSGKLEFLKNKSF